ncbi:uncharacterized protein [Diadema setosum]|uniref:uncharacterized protein isoform X2 n=1 Tax=Diadema setosum TaxID=31175 RepID=UPI003B3A9E28
MGCMCCCFRPTDSRALEEPSALVKTDESTKALPQKSYGAISPEEEKPKKTSPSSSPRRSPTDLLYSEPPKSARAKSPELTSTTTSDTAPLVASSKNASKADDSPRKTLAEIANLKRITKSALPPSSSSAAARHKTRTSTPNPTVQNDSNTKVEDHHSEDVSSPAVSASVGVGAASAESLESDTCHSPGQLSEEDEDEEEEEEEGEDERILRMLPAHPQAPSVTSEGSETRLVSRASTLTSSSPTSSALDVSKDSQGKKQSKTKGFFKKAGKNMKKAKKKVGKGVEKMLKHDKKKEDEGKEANEQERTTSAASTDTHDTSSSSSQFKRVSSDRMKSKYARDKLAALEKKREEASHRTDKGFTDPRQTEN